MAPVKNICSVLLSRKYASWSDLESQIERLQDTTEKGDAFEQFCYFYFCFYSALYQISSIFTPKINGKEIPHNLRTKYKLSKKDDGVDGLFITTDGKATVYQAKFRSGRKSPPSNELNNFWAEGEYADYRLVIANATSLPADVQKRKNNLSVLVNAFDDLPADFFDFHFIGLTVDGDRKLAHGYFLLLNQVR